MTGLEKFSRILGLGLSEIFGEAGELPITSQARRNLVRNLIPAFHERGIGANEALSLLRGLGLGYRRQDFLYDYREGLSSFKQRTRIRYVGGDRIPTESILESKYHGVPDRYSFVFRVRGVDKTSGEKSEDYFMYHSNTLKTKRDLKNLALSFYQSKSDIYNLDVEEIEVVEGYINPVYG